MEALTSGYTWQEDPDQNRFAAGGRTTRKWLRAEEDHRVQALFKIPPFAKEIYSLGMERVAYTLGAHLDLPVPVVWLEEYHGRDGALLRRVPNSRTWQMAGAAPMLLANVTNRDTWPLSVVFDVWLANGDRVPRNILVEPLPEGRRAAVASSSRTWLIDNGFTGLWFPAKFDQRLTIGQAANVVVGDGEMCTGLEENARRIMPSEYRAAFTGLSDADQTGLLDVVKQVSDDRIEESVREIPDTYFSSTEAEKTITLLKVRRDRVEELVKTRW